MNQKKAVMSSVIHAFMVEAFSFPEDKKFHRFFPMKQDDFHYPSDRTEAYTIIEISLFEGRSMQAKKDLIRLLLHRLQQEPDLAHEDIETTIFETPKSNCGIRGLPGDELALNYNVNM
ncbi:tautomerase family protein [Alkalicoccus chagannorensis]